VRVRLVISFLLLLAIPAVAQHGDPPMPMAQYTFGLLRRGPSWTPERNARTDSIQAGHMANIGRMHEAGILLAAGPFAGGGDWRGIFIFRADSLHRVREMAAGDPAISSGRLVLDLYPWYAPAGIGELYRERAKQPGHRDSMRVTQFAMLQRGPKFITAMTPEVRKIQNEHVAGIFRNLLSGQLATAGPLGDGPDSTFAGILVFRADSATARSLAAADPAIQSGRLATRWLEWWVGWGTFPGDTL
jgi:uncharacterized protein